MKQTQEWFSIFLALTLMLLLSFTGLYVIEHMIPFSRNVKGVENASQAFFESYAGIEEAFYDIHSGNIGDEFQDSLDVSQSNDFSFIVEATGSLLPPQGMWQSNLDLNWNTLSIWKPVQLLIWKGRLNSPLVNNRIRLLRRVPNFDGAWGVSDNDVLNTLDGDNEMILWQLSSGDETLFTRSWSLITESDINSSNQTNLWTQWGTRLDGVTDERFRDFYAGNCSALWEECVLKITLIQDIVSTDNRKLPFLEYQIRTTADIPTRFAHVESFGQSSGFGKKLESAVPQETTNSAFDFTIFQ